ncbi:MAG TPA: LuxR C-terminal-related transcriptional regulator [Sphaerochaeta sp.]|nr:LuxR C-terminal-related transcriptional regulator [Sphaerochaeta sp.]
MFIIGDILLFLTTALVFSITCLCVLLHVRAKDAYTRGFLTILIPLCLQMFLTMLYAYIPRVYPPELLTGDVYLYYCLTATLVSIFLTTLMLFSMSRYLISLLPATEKEKSLGKTILGFLILAFLIISLVIIIGKSDGDWVYAMNLTFSYHLFSGSVFMIIHGFTSLFYRKKAHGWEQERLLTGICATFIPLLVLFPLDLIFFWNHAFKFTYLSFSAFAVYLYYFISRRYFLTYEAVNEASVTLQTEFLEEHDVSAREQEIIALLIQGQSNREIAEKLFISPNTVKTHIKNIYAKLGVTNRVLLFSLLQKKSNP